MSILKDYEARMKIEPLTEDEILYVVEDSEAFLTGGRRSRDPRRIDEIPRVVVFLYELVCTQSERLGLTKIPEVARCAHCLTSAGGTDEAWMDLPSMTFDEAQAHAQVCEHNPLVRRNRELEAQVEDLRGRALGIDDGLRDAIRALLRSEAPAGELRRALGELVR